jgi:hypothetical protein
MLALLHETLASSDLLATTEPEVWPMAIAAVLIGAAILRRQSDD